MTLAGLRCGRPSTRVGALDRRRDQHPRLRASRRLRMAWSRDCLPAHAGRRAGRLGDPVALPPRVRRDGDAPPHLQPAVDRRSGDRAGRDLDGVAVIHLARRTARPLVNPPSAIARRTRAGTRRSRCPRGRESASGTACANFSQPTATLTAFRHSVAGIRSSRGHSAPKGVNRWLPTVRCRRRP